MNAPSNTSKLAPSVNSGRRRACVALLSANIAPFAWTNSVEPVLRHRVVDLDWVDSARSRSVPARLYLPRADALSHPVSLMVFSHGIGGSRGNYSYLGRYWAEQGVASLHVQHVGSDRSVWGGNPLTIVSRLRAAAQEHEAIDRVRDIRFALDCLLESDGPEAGLLIDRSRIVVAGHSYGANTVLLAIGARVERNGRWVDFHDPRFSAAVIISAPPFYGESDLPAILRNVAVPTLHVTSTEDVIRIPGMYSGVEDRVAVYDAVPDPRKTLVMYRGGSHSIFTDRPGPGGLHANQKVKAATAELTLAFLQHTFGSDTSALQRWNHSWHPLVARFAEARLKTSVALAG